MQNYSFDFKIQQCINHTIPPPPPYPQQYPSHLPNPPLASAGNALSHPFINKIVSHSIRNSMNKILYARVHIPLRVALILRANGHTSVCVRGSCSFTVWFTLLNCSSWLSLSDSYTLARALALSFARTLSHDVFELAHAPPLAVWMPIVWILFAFKPVVTVQLLYFCQATRKSSKRVSYSFPNTPFWVLKAQFGKKKAFLR